MSVNIDLEAARTPISEADIAFLRQEWHGHPLSGSFIRSASLGEIPFACLAIRPWGRNLVERFARMSDDAEATDFLRLVAILAQSHPALIRGDITSFNKIFDNRTHWIRDPADWSPGRWGRAAEKTARLLHHLFIPYRKGTNDYFELPPGTWRYWHKTSPRWPDGQALERAIFLHLAAGKPLQKLEQLSVHLTRKQMRDVLEYYPWSCFREAVIAVCLGDPQTIGADRHRALLHMFCARGDIYTSIALIEDEQQRRQQQEEFAFWQQVMAFFARHRELDPDRVVEICDFIRFRKFYSRALYDAHGNRLHDAQGRPLSQAPPDPHFSLKGRTPRSLLRLVEAWHEELAHAQDARKTRFKGSGLPSFRIPDPDAPGYFWRMRELLSSGALHLEGRLMQHCVYSYAESCERDESFIFSLERYAPAPTAEEIASGSKATGSDGALVKKHLTIELDRSLSIVQIRGKVNRSHTPEEAEILILWEQWRDDVLQQMRAATASQPSTASRPRPRPEAAAEAEAGGGYHERLFFRVLPRIRSGIADILRLGNHQPPRTPG